MDPSNSIAKSLTDGVQMLKQWHTEHLWQKGDAPKGYLWETLNREIDKRQLSDEIEKQGGLTLAQRQKLKSVFNSYAQKVSSPFGRHFGCSESALLTVDVYGRPDEKLLSLIEPFTHLEKVTGKTPAPGSYENAVLMHIRKDNKKLALTGGGFADADETCLEAISRELHEETGGGCLLQNVKIKEIWDARRGGPEHRISVTYTGKISGFPKANHEAEEFFFVREQDLKDLPADKEFASHFKMVARHFRNLNAPENKEGINCVATTPDVDSKALWNLIEKQKTVQPSQYVEKCIERVSQLYSELSAQFETWSQQKLGEDFSKSRDAIPGWSKSVSKLSLETEESKKWNDDLQLWNFLESFKTAAIKISNLFQTHVTTGECGVIEQAMLLKTFDQHSCEQPDLYAVMNSNGIFRLPTA